MTHHISAADRDRIRTAAESNHLDVDESDGTDPAPGDPERSDLLAVFRGPPPSDSGGNGTPRPGAYSVAVRVAPTARDTASAITGGHHFVLESPLDARRVDHLLRYLSAVAAPDAARVLGLDGSTLSTTTRSVTLTAAQAAVVRLAAQRPGRILSRSEIAAASGADARTVVEQVRRAMAGIGSGAQILKVPHMGFRLTGEVRLTDRGAEPA